MAEVGGLRSGVQWLCRCSAKKVYIVHGEFTRVDIWLKQNVPWNQME